MAIHAPAGPGDGGIEVPDPSALADATGALAGEAARVAGLKTIAAAVVGRTSEVAGPGQERELVVAALLPGETGAALVTIDLHRRRFARAAGRRARGAARAGAGRGEGEAEAEAAAKALLRRSEPGLFLARLQASCVGERVVSASQPKPGSE